MPLLITAAALLITAALLIAATLLTAGVAGVQVCAYACACVQDHHLLQQPYLQHSDITYCSSSITYCHNII